MRAHKLNLTVPPNHQVTLQLPDDFPVGPVEVIVLATSSMRKRRYEAPRALPHVPVLGNVVIYDDDLGTTVDAQDWPARLSEDWSESLAEDWPESESEASTHLCGATEGGLSSLEMRLMAQGYRQ